jgi:uncharacterized phage-associated protein
VKPLLCGEDTDSDESESSLIIQVKADNMRFDLSKKCLIFRLRAWIALRMIIRRVQRGDPTTMSTAIRFRFNPLKAVQVAAMFLRLHGGRMKFLTLLKLMYKADRVAFEKIDKPITGDTYVSMDKGPVLSGVYDLIKDNKKYQDTEIWKKYISTRDDSSSHEVRLLTDPGSDELSEEEETIIEDAYKEWGRLDRFDIVALTHDFPEWQDPAGSSIPIEVLDILKNVGKTQKEIDYIREIAAREAYLDKILNG